MRFDIITIFPAFFGGPLDYGIVRRAREAGLVEIGVHDLRDFTHDRHRTVDDRPFGGGEGMVLKPEPLFEAVESIVGGGAASAQASGAEASANQDAGLKPGATRAGDEAGVDAGGANGTAIVLLSASGKLFRQAEAVRLASLQRIVLLCGRYEGVDERVAEHLATDELSIGDFVLSGGELAAALILDSVTRLLPGALGNEASVIEESFSARGENGGESIARGAPGGQTIRQGVAGREGEGASQASGAVGRDGSLLLDYPHYTRPAEFRGWPVPEILMGGNHEEVRRWRQRMALEKTRRNRPDLLRGNS